MNYPAGTLGVFMELYEAEVERFIEYLRSLSERPLTASATLATELVSVDSILRHVISSGVGYADDVRAALRGAPPLAESAGGWAEQLRHMVSRMADAVASEWGKSEDELNATMIQSSWGQRYSLDQLMEHAIVHVLWHRRQCGRVVARAAGSMEGEAR